MHIVAIPAKSQRTHIVLGASTIVVNGIHDFSIIVSTSVQSTFMYAACSGAVYCLSLESVNKAVRANRATTKNLCGLPAAVLCFTSALGVQVAILSFMWVNSTPGLPLR